LPGTVGPALEADTARRRTAVSRTLEVASTRLITNSTKDSGNFGGSYFDRVIELEL
jgi:hypothetical protein